MNAPINPSVQTPLKPSVTIGLGETWGGANNGWTAPFTQDANRAPQGLATVASYRGGQQNCAVSLTNAGFQPTLSVVSWL
jgi:hypothetical protein